MVRSSGFEPPRYCYRQPLKLVRLPVPPRPHRGENFIVAARRQPRKPVASACENRLLRSQGFFGCVGAGCGAAGVFPAGCWAAGCEVAGALPDAGELAGGVELCGAGAFVTGAGTGAGVFAGAGFEICCSTEPFCSTALSTRTTIANAHTMNMTAHQVVACERIVAAPRGPNAVWLPAPPKAPARSAAFPL